MIVIHKKIDKFQLIIALNIYHQIIIFEIDRIFINEYILFNMKKFKIIFT